MNPSVFRTDPDHCISVPVFGINGKCVFRKPESLECVIFQVPSYKHQNFISIPIGDVLIPVPGDYFFLVKWSPVKIRPYLFVYNNNTVRLYAGRLFLGIKGNGQTE
jgi:hypothetical protein